MEKEASCIMTERTERKTRHRDIAIPNVCAPSNKASKHTKQNMLEVKAEMGKPTVIVQGFNAPLSATDKMT